MTSVERDAYLARAAELQDRLHAAFRPHPWRMAIDLHRAIRTYLVNASNQRLIVQPQEEIHKWLRMSGGRKDIPNATHSIAYGQGVNFSRDPAWPHLSRQQDSAWFDFQLSVRESSYGVEVLAYGFELRLVGENRPLEFFRIDMNHSTHANTHDGHRSHLHLNCDDDGFVVPAAVMGPYELLDAMLFGAVRDNRTRGQKQG